MSAHAQAWLSPEQYLAIEREAEFRSEYFDGVMYSIAGGSLVHSHIMGNITREFGIALKKRPCLVMPADARVRVGQGILYCYPDLVIACEPREYASEDKDTLVNPTLLVEVLSPSTELSDRATKASRYRGIASLQAYVLVSQNEPHVEIYHRNAAGEWVVSDVDGLDASCQFDGLAGASISIPMSEIYDKVEF
jgi:Uma2 family endonuclease